MPWTKNDAKAKNSKITTDHEAEVWTKAANDALARFLKEGRPQAEAEVAAIRTANAVLAKMQGRTVDGEEETRIWLIAEELRIAEAEGQPTRIEGLAVPYGQLSDDLGGFVERIMPGAFDAALAGDGELIVDREHDHEPLARRSKGTAQFESRNAGLWVSFIAPDTTKGRDTLADVRNGNLDALSVSWLRKGTQDRFLTEEGRNVREVLAAPLTGVTLTYRPAYRQTVNTLTIRSLEAWKADQEKWRIQQANRRRRLELERRALRDNLT